MPLKIVSFIAIGFSVVYALLGMSSAASSLASSQQNVQPTIETVQASLIQGSFTNSFVLASITFGLIGLLGVAVSIALKSLEARLVPAS
jgi:hypothetical protein